MRHARQQVANTVDAVQARRDLLTRPLAAINDCTYKIRREVRDDLKAIAKGFKPVAAPGIEVRRRVSEGLKVGVIDILVKDGHSLQLDSPNGFPLK